MRRPEFGKGKKFGPKTSTHKQGNISRYGSLSPTKGGRLVKKGSKKGSRKR